MTFLKASIPLNKIDIFRDLLEENGQQLAGRSLSDLIPFIRQEEVSCIVSELDDKKVAVIFDGTTRLGEAMAIILRFLDENWEVQQHLVHLRHLSVLQIDYNISNNSLIGAMHDRASVNSVAMQTVKILYPCVLDIGCFSHTLDIVGDKFRIPHLVDFFSAWITMFAYSPKA